MKICSASQIIREMQIKSIMRYHFIHFEKGKKKKKCWYQFEKVKLLCFVGGNVKWCSH